MKTEIEWIERKIRNPNRHGVFLICGRYVDEDFLIDSAVSMAYFDKTKHKWSFSQKDLTMSIIFWAEVPRMPIN